MRTVLTSLLLASSVTCAYAATTTQPSIAEIQTSVGTITVQLNHDKAPISAKNFLDYATSGFYKDTFIHRSVKDFVVQGGGMDAKTMQFKETKAPIVSEANNGLSNLKGTVAMARTSDPNSATSQFYFNLKDNLVLDKDAPLDDKGTKSAGYTVFGNVIAGLDIVEKIGGYTTIQTSYSEGVPFSEVDDCGFNFCLKKVIIENVYISDVVDNVNSITRVTVNGTGGRIVSQPTSISCISTSKSCILKKPFGTAVTLNVKPSKGYEFKGWSGDCSGNNVALTLDTKSKNNNCTATFGKIGV